MSLRPAAAAAPVGAPVCLGGEPPRLHLVLRAGQAAETGLNAKEVLLKTKVAKAILTGKFGPVKEQLGLEADATVAQIKTVIEPWLKRLRAMIKDDARLAKFDRVLQKLRRITTGVALPKGCDWNAYVAEKPACKGLTKAQEDELYRQMSEQRDKENYIFSVFMYLLRIAFMLD